MNPFKFVEPITFPPGRYYCGDPAYVIPDNLWDSFCDLIGVHKESHIQHQNKYIFWWGETAYGDGTYPIFYKKGPLPNRLGVDAGLLSIIPLEFIETINEDINYKELITLGIILEISNPFTISYSNGDFSFDNFYVNTSGEGKLMDEYFGDEDDEEWEEEETDEGND